MELFIFVASFIYICKGEMAEKPEMTAEQKTKRKVMLAVLVVTGFIVVVSVVLVAVTLQLSPKIDELGKLSTLLRVKGISACRG